MQNPILEKTFAIKSTDSTFVEQKPTHPHINPIAAAQDGIENVGHSLSQSTNKLYLKLNSWSDIIIGNIPNIILAIIVLIIGFKTLKIIQRWTNKLVKRITDNTSVSNLTENIVTIIYSALILFLVLAIFDLDATINKILATAGVVGLAVGLALQEPLTNLFSGIQMSIQHPYSIGDIVETNGHFGVIKEISLSNTEITLFSGKNVVIPNKKVIQQSLTNYSNNKLHRMTIELGVEYDADLEMTKEIIIEAVKSLEQVIRNKPVEVFYTEFSDSSIRVKVLFWHLLRTNHDLLSTKSDAIVTIKKALDRENIRIPFPIQTIEMVK